MKKINIFLNTIIFSSVFFMVNAQSMQYNLYNAISSDSEQAICEAIKNGADINEYLDGVNCYPLKFAVVNGKEKAVEVLLSRGAIIPYDESGGLVFQYQTLSYTASKLSNPKVYFLILQKMMTYGDNWIPWCHSVYVEYIRNLIKQRKIEQAIHGLRIGNKFLKEATPVLKNGVEVPFVVNKIERNLAFPQIIMEDVFELLNYELFNYQFEKTPIKTDLFLDLLQELINVGYNVNKIWSLADHGYHLYTTQSILKLVLKNGASASRKILFHEITSKRMHRKTYPIFEAIYAGNLTSIKILLDHYASSNQALDDYDYYCLRGLSNDRFMGDKTPFCYARELGRDDIVELLLSYGADV